VLANLAPTAEIGTHGGNVERVVTGSEEIGLVTTAERMAR